MKKILATFSLALVAIISCVGLVGCKKNNAKDDYRPKEYVGTYNFSNLKITYENSQGEIQDNTAEFINSFKDSFISLNKDGSVTTNYFDKALKYFLDDSVKYTAVYSAEWISVNGKIMFNFDIKYLDENGNNLEDNKELAEAVNWPQVGALNVPYWIIKDGKLIADCHYIAQYNLYVEYGK